MTTPKYLLKYLSDHNPTHTGCNLKPFGTEPSPILENNKDDAIYDN